VEPTQVDRHCRCADRNPTHINALGTEIKTTGQAVAAGCGDGHREARIITREATGINGACLVDFQLAVGREDRCNGDADRRVQYYYRLRPDLNHSSRIYSCRYLSSNTDKYGEILTKRVTIASNPKTAARLRYLWCATRRPGRFAVQTLVDVQIQCIDRSIPVEVRIDIVVGITHR